MLAKTESVALIGTEAHLVDVEVDVGTGIPNFSIVGLPTPSVREAEHRTRSALLSSEERWPPHRIVANLAPAGLRKEGTHFDLALALGILAGDGHIDKHALGGWIAIGELGLDGSVRGVRGVLAAAIACREAGRRGLICPGTNAPEAALIDGIEIIAVGCLKEAKDYLGGQWLPPPIERIPDPPSKPTHDMLDVRGHEHAKRALEIAAAGGHNVLLMGPPGCGKTMLARRLPSILPPMSVEESIAVTRIYSVAGLMAEKASLLHDRPFRSPHHHITIAGLVGGGSGLPRPGEVSLAHLGVLFLDEVCQFKSEVLETLRVPLEEGVVRIARSGGLIAYPCRFSLIAATNPCPCGHSSDKTRDCLCSARRLRAYKGKLSGPLLDRIDMQIGMERLNRAELLGNRRGESSSTIRDRVEAARLIQAERYRFPHVTNASAAMDIERVQMTADARHELESSVEKGELTGRSLNRVLRVARTIADLNGAETISDDDVGEAITLRIDPTLGAAA